MVFSSLSFLVFFLPVLLALYYLTPFRGVRNLLLLAASLLFYAWGGPRQLPLLLLSAGLNYACGMLAEPKPGRSPLLRRFAVGCAAAAGIGLLLWFKYAGFFARSLNALGAGLPLPEPALPVGISFFTFQGLSYVIDVYRGEARAQRNPLHTALYIAFFPQLTAGPIVRYASVAEALSGRRESLADFSTGAVRFCVGLGKKLLLANTVAGLADAAFARSPDALSAGLAWLGAVGYTFQIYFDFSGYSDMAIGLGKLFGFTFGENFRYPYTAGSITEFWRRWHISLSSWFRDYVYIPLGGGRCSAARQRQNLAVVWLLTGLWHGANWTFVVWGAWYLLLLWGEKLFFAAESRPGLLRHAATLLAVMLGWVLFRSDSLAHARGYCRALLGGAAAPVTGEAQYYARLYLPALLLCIPASLPLAPATERFLQRHGAGAALLWLPKLWALVLLVLSYAMLATGSYNPFIYFQF